MLYKNQKKFDYQVLLPVTSTTFTKLNRDHEVQYKNQNTPASKNKNISAKVPDFLGDF